MSVLACFTRTDKPAEEKVDVWLTEQLKFTRDQLDKKSRQCEQLDAELRRLKEQRLVVRPEELEALKESHRQELERLSQELANERDLHQEASRLLQGQREQRDAKVQMLQEELRNLSDGLAQKEEDMLNIQFSMVELQNRCSDQGALVEENADAFQKASEELAEKEEALEQAVQRQQELRQQMSAASTALQGQVRQLSQELEHCQAAKSTAQSALSRLQDENASLAAQLLQANTEMESLRERLQEQEAAAVRRQTQLEDEIQGLVQLASKSQDGWSSPAFTLDDRGRSTPEPGADHGAGAAPSFCEATPLVPSVLIAAEIDLGPASSGRATLTVSPWQTSSDYNSVVKEFLAHHRVKPIFEKAVVLYLEDLERSATTFPLLVKASLTEIYSRYG
ncbi:unnamed protein product [Symbiodinium necroappetens]|uniref:Uncharacterized protein n=1 Tax=Symbiodinium necroappetens TaxID=1628268 RepID=A0A812SJQ9_9DINO|nr:unnamed protein product [Symbiodinium necroappetens]